MSDNIPNFDKLIQQVEQQILAESAARGQMKLGDFIAALKTAHPDASVFIDWNMLNPLGFQSYRGIYNHLAIGFAVDRPTMRVAMLLRYAQLAIDQTFQGYKGGDFEMGEHTPLWVANWGHSSGVYVKGLDVTPHIVRILTGIEDGQ